MRENRGLPNFGVKYDEMRGIDPDTLADELRSAPECVPVPDYAFDCHTRRGKAMGMTKADFFKAGQEALVPLEQGLLDHLVGESWSGSADISHSLGGGVEALQDFPRARTADLGHEMRAGQSGVRPKSGTAHGNGGVGQAGP